MRPFTMVRLAGALALVLAAGAARAETVEVKINKLAYDPVHITAHVGDTVHWVNGDFVAHTATARDKSWDFMIPSNGAASLTLKAAGNIDYYCRFHPNMVGTISVAP